MSPGITMDRAISALVAEKRAVGYSYVAEERVLARFAAFCRAEFPGLDAPDRASVEAWVAAARSRGAKPATLQALAAPVRELCRGSRILHSLDHRKCTGDCGSVMGFGES